MDPLLLTGTNLASHHQHPVHGRDSMSKRAYISCRQCRRRTRSVFRDKDGQRRFQLCAAWGWGGTWLVDQNGVTDDWPREVVSAESGTA